MGYIGVSLYVFWLLLTMFKFGSSPQDRSFSYSKAIFGNIVWYYNLRTILFLISAFIIAYYVPLKIAYLLIFLTAILLGITCLKNFFKLIGNPWVDLGLATVSTLTAVLSGIFILKK